MSEHYTITDLTPPALADVIHELGGGMLQSVVISAEWIDADGERKMLSMWDYESSLANQLGLARALTLALDHRMMCGLGLDNEDS